MLFFLLRIIEVNFNHETPPHTSKRRKHKVCIRNRAAGKRKWPFWGLTTPPLPLPHTHSRMQTNKSRQNIYNANFEHAVWQINCCCNLCYHTWFSYIIIEYMLSSCTLLRHLQASVLALSYLAQGPQHTHFLNKNAADTESLERII